jgi:uncharacterized protein (TIGR00369 family)
MGTMEKFFRSAPSVSNVGIEPLFISDGKCKMKMAVKPEFMNVIGTLHAGITTFLADTSMFGAAWSTLRNGESVTTLEIKINLLKAVRGGILEAEAKILKRGRTIVLSAADIKDEKGDLVAHATSTLMVIKKSIT